MNLPLRIKKKQPYIKTYTALGVIMLILSLLCLFSPFIPIFETAFNDSLELVYMIIGGVCTPFFSFFTCYSIMTLLSPQNAIVIKDIGFYDYTMPGGGAGFVPAESIVSLRIFGNNKKQYLGVRIDEDYNVNLGVGTRAKREIRNNLESGMPAVIIKGCDVAIEIPKLQELLLKAYSRSEYATSENSADRRDYIPPVDECTGDEADTAIGYIAPETDAPILSPIESDVKAESINAATTPEDADDEPVITIEPEQDKPRITSVDELLAHIFKDNKSGEQ